LVERRAHDPGVGSSILPSATNHHSKSILMGQELTVEQIQEAITAKPELKTAVIGSLKEDFLTSLKSEGVTVRKKEEEAEFLSNYEKNIIPGKVEAEIGAKIKAVHDQYDNDLFELTGERKQPTEKTYEFMKRKLTEMKEKAGKGGKDDPVLADQIKELQSKLKQYEGYVAPDEVQKIKDSHFKENINFRLTAALEKKPIAVPAHITDEKQKQDYIAMQRNMIRADFMGRFTAKQNSEGQTVYYDGETLLTNEANASAMTEEQIIEKNYTGYFVPPAKPAGGAGSGASGSGKGADANEASLKTKAEVQEYLNKKGLITGGQEFNKEYLRICKDYAITE
jgi:hypothetical protein